MTLLEKLQEDMKSAMKSGQKERLGVIRMLLSDVKNIDLAPRKTTAEEAVAAYAKKLQKSMAEYQRLGRRAEVDQLKGELAVVEEYLPQKASAEQTRQRVDDFLASHSFTEKQFGQAMGAFMKAHGQDVDPAVAGTLLKEKLAGK